MLVLAHATGVCLLRSDAVMGVVSMTGDPGEHLKRCCDPLIRVLLDSDSQQVTAGKYISSSAGMKVRVSALFN